MSERLQNWNNWRYLPIGTKEREAWHELDRLFRKNKELQLEIIRLENVEEKAQAIVRYMRATKPDGVMSVITELGLLYPPKEGEEK